jgi:membrane-associated phospholipid phosphatase
MAVVYYGRMNYVDWYRRISAPFRSAIAREVIVVADKALVLFIAVAYFASIVLLFVRGEVLAAVRVVLVPAITFALITYLRDRWNTNRPYEDFDIDPIIQKDERGRSMPSRHVSSAVIIACALAWQHMDWGALAFAACAVVAFTRIVGGVHYPRDVAVGAAIALVCGFLGFVIIPS